MADIHQPAVGQIVFSKSGRDKGMAFIVLNAEDGYVWLADGNLRRVEKPKKKKRMHIQPVKSIDEEIRIKVTKRMGVTDADLRKALTAFHLNRPDSKTV